MKHKIETEACLKFKHKNKIQDMCWTAQGYITTKTVSDYGDNL